MDTNVSTKLAVNNPGLRDRALISVFVRWLHVEVADLPLVLPLALYLLIRSDFLLLYLRQRHLFLLTICARHDPPSSTV